jgi:hypothetical protein
LACTEVAQHFQVGFVRGLPLLLDEALHEALPAAATHMANSKTQLEKRCRKTRQ